MKASVVNERAKEWALDYTFPRAYFYIMLLARDKGKF